MNIKKIKTAVKHSTGTVSSDAEVIAKEVQRSTKRVVKVNGGPAGIAKRGVQKMDKHAPTALAVAGVGGILVSTFFIGKTSMKVGPILEEHRMVRDRINQVMEIADKGELTNDQTYSKKDYYTDIAANARNTTIKLVKMYALPVAGLGLSVAALLLSNKMLRARQMAALAAASVLTEQFDKYRSNVREFVGEEREKDIYEGRALRLEKDAEIKVSRKIYPEKDSRLMVLFDEVTSKEWDREKGLNRIRVSAVQNAMNNRLQAKGHLFVNDVLRELGINDTPEGAVMGWLRSEGSVVDFGLGELTDQAVLDFVNDKENSIWLRLNTDGLIWDRI